MKIVVIGGASMIVSRLVERLRRDGHESLAGSPDSGVNPLTGDGLSEALHGVHVVVDVSHAPAWDDTTLVEFFQTSSRNLLAAETVARVRHHVVLSVVGTDRLPESAYFRAKAAQEEAVKSGPVPYTILRVAPPFECIAHTADSSTDANVVRLPPAFVQPEAAEDIASTLSDVAVGSPLNDTVELAGPEAFRLDELARRVMKARADRRRVWTDIHALYYGAELDDASLAPSDDARIASTRFEDWLSHVAATPGCPSRQKPETEDRDRASDPRVRAWPPDRHRTPEGSYRCQP